MIRTAAALLLATAALAPLPAAAQTAAPRPAISPARQALALELAKVLNPAELTLATTDRVLSEQMPTAMRADPEMKALEDRYPGILAAMVEAIKPILMRHLRKTMPDLWQHLADMFASELSEDDLRAAIAFYSSPTGQRMIALMASNLDASPFIADISANDYLTTPESLTTATRSTALNAVSKLTPAELRDATAFARTPSGQRFVALRPQVMKITSDWSNAPAPEAEAEAQAALIPVIERFTGEKINP